MDKIQKLLIKTNENNHSENPNNMTSAPIAVIDMGTNTFNLLIAGVNGQKMTEIYFEKIPVKLGKGGMQQKIITPEAKLRAVEAMIRYKEIADRYHVQEILASGTSALRSATNSKELLDRIKEITGIDVRIISGDEEALLIYTGVTHSIHPEGTFLIMDVGGGSVEFILASQPEGIIWKKSFPLGVTRLLELFDLSDPVTEDNIQTLEDYLDQNLPELWEVVSRHHPGMLIGAAGTFDTLRSLAAGKGWIPKSNKSWQEIPPDIYRKIHQILLRSDAVLRKRMKGMEPFRVKMIVPASIFVNFVLRKTEIPSLVQSYYSLKEGIIFRLIETRNEHKK